MRVQSLYEKYRWEKINTKILLNHLKLSNIKIRGLEVFKHVNLEKSEEEKEKYERRGLFTPHFLFSNSPNFLNFPLGGKLIILSF
jgi:hypothetical protein